MLLSDYLFNESKEIWNTYLEHPFIIELAEGRLPKEKFREYLIQDYLYLIDYAKVYAMGLIKSDDIEDIKFFQKSINGILEDESATHIEYLKEFGEEIAELQKYKSKSANENYTNFMKSVSLTGDKKDLIIAVLPCAWSYYYIAKNIKEKYKHKLENNFYAKWVESYCSDGYKLCVKENIEFANKICGNLEDIDEKKKQKLKEIFRKASLYESKFWDMAYKEME